ncbi:response regulator [Paenibacillus sp. S-38]|uniref:response regulator n=1 Tax=Paenibacillus sp. S-38 TaxID=3416710 RepID=UPI003CF5D12D
MNPTNPHFSVILIEDDPMVQEVNRQFIERVEGFRVEAAASGGSEGLQLIRTMRPHLVFLDIFMPGLGGIETLAQLRSEQLPVEVIVVSAANDQGTVERMFQNGAFDYIMKPFKFERVRQALERYRSMKNLLGSDRPLTQAELDRLRFASASPLDEAVPAAPSVLPKGLQAVTMKQIVNFLSGQIRPLSAEEVAEGIGIARVTARRYLDYLEKNGHVRLDLQYGVGRPVNTYVMTTNTDSWL